MTLSPNTAVEVVVFLNISGTKCGTYRFYYRDGTGVSYQSMSGDTPQFDITKDISNKTFSFSLPGFSMMLVKTICGECNVSYT